MDEVKHHQVRPKTFGGRPVVVVSCGDVMELGRRGKPEEVASVIVFLCSERASFVNGSTYRVDAGSVATI